MTAWGMIRAAAAGDPLRERAEAGWPALHPSWAAAYPSLARNGLHGFTDYDEGHGHDGFVHLETGHRLYLGASAPDEDRDAKWALHVTHDHDYEDPSNGEDSFYWGRPSRKVIADLGQGDEGVGDRVMEALRHPEVMKGMRRLMTPPAHHEWWNHNVDLRGR